VLDITRAKTVSDPPGVTHTSRRQPEWSSLSSPWREFAPSSSADMWMNTTDTMGDINPGNSIQVKVAFDVPPCTPTEGVVLEMHDSMLSGGVQVQLGAPSAGGD